MADPKSAARQRRRPTPLIVPTVADDIRRQALADALLHRLNGLRARLIAQGLRPCPDCDRFDPGDPMGRRFDAGVTD